MPSRKKYDAVATIGTYKDRHTGEEKKRFANVGTVFENEEGRLSLKLDTIPVGPGWSGYISFYEPRDSGQQQSPPPRQSQHNQSKSNGYQPQEDGEDDIPF